MRNIWVISDTHFNHENILKFKGSDDKPIRNFHDVHHMNEIMIENWNKLIKTNDKVYHLGDVYFGNREEAGVLLSRLNGKKRLILGNHDYVYGNNILSKRFEKILMWKKWGDLGLLFTHVPVHPTTLGESRFSEKSFINVHGHIHQNKSPDGPYRCVCVEHTDYAPVHIDQLLK